MIKDLYTIKENINLTTQVCIVGAGTVGIYLAKKLRDKNIEVILLESGDNVVKTPEEFQLESVQKGISYSGAENGRGIGLGGTSALWGGQMIPLVESDFKERNYIGFNKWPISYEEVKKFFSTVASELGLGSFEGSKEYKKLLKRHYKILNTSSKSSNFSLRLSQWLPFKMRNSSKAFSKLVETDEKLQVWLNSTVTKLRKNSDNKIETIYAQSKQGKKIEIKSKIVVICAGALESTRLLLEFDEQNEKVITKYGSPLGECFSDHLSVTCGTLKCNDWKRFNLNFSPVFEKGIMRTPRLELTQEAQKEESLTSAFAHFTFLTNGDTGFDIVRSILRKNQGEQHKIELSFKNIFSSLSDIFSMVWWRYIHNRLWIPRKADLLLQIDIEQIANKNSKLYLDNEYDTFNRKKLCIDWQVTDQDFDVIRKTTVLVTNFWNDLKLDEVATLELEDLKDLESFSTPYDVYHPTGSVKMGSTKENSVVNSDLRLWDISNCYVDTTSVFPSPGSANPGMVHFALTERLAKHLEKKIKREIDES